MHLAMSSNIYISKVILGISKEAISRNVDNDNLSLFYKSFFMFARCLRSLSEEDLLFGEWAIIYRPAYCYEKCSNWLSWAISYCKGETIPNFKFGNYLIARLIT